MLLNEGKLHANFVIKRWDCSRTMRHYSNFVVLELWKLWAVLHSNLL